MQNKIKFKYFLILYISLIISTAKTAEEAVNNEFCLAAKGEENNCSFHTFKVVKPLLDYFREFQNKLRNHESLIANKDREIIELKVQMAKIAAENAQKDKTIKVHQKLEDSNAAQLESLRENIRLLKSARHESDQLTELTRTVAANSETIRDQNRQIMKFKARNESDCVKCQTFVDQLANNAKLVREKSEIITSQLQNINIFVNKTQFELEEFKKLSIEVLVDSCLPFATSPGFHTIKLPGINPFNVLCQNAATGAGWIVIQQRINGKEDFVRNFTTYQAGFGSLKEDFFLGLEKIHQLTAYRRHELYIHLERFNGEITYATYNHFALAGEKEQYKLIHVDGFSGNTTNSEDYMQLHKGQKFYTFDRDNSNNCSKKYHGGWWYASCLHSNLNGVYFNREVNDPTGICWYDWDTLKKVQMLIRPRFD